MSRWWQSTREWRLKHFHIARTLDLFARTQAADGVRSPRTISLLGSFKTRSQARSQVDVLYRDASCQCNLKKRREGFTFTS